jgi:hypothetical protein
VMWFVAAVAGSMFDCVLKSGSLKDRRCVEPEAIADLAAAFQPDVDFRPQSMGTNSRLDRIVPPGALPQLYAQVIPVPAKAFVSEASLNERPRLPPVEPPLLPVELGAAADEAALEYTLDATCEVANVVGTDTAAEEAAAGKPNDECW